MALLSIEVFLNLLMISMSLCAPTSPTKKTDKFDLLIKPNSPENIARLKNLSESDLAEELSGQYQGDIIISDEEIEEIEGNRRTAMVDEGRLWSNAIIPYRVNESHFTSEQLAYIHLGAQKLMEVSCLQFVAYDPEQHADFVTVRGPNSGCSSYVGIRGGEQFVNLTPNDLEIGCFRLYTIVHEFLHVAGFFHMQAAFDRDEYVRIDFDMIQFGYERNFLKVGEDIITHLNVEYDYGSCMHYSSTAFSVNGNATIISLRDLHGVAMGQRMQLSEKDIRRLNRRYCNEPTETPITSPGATTEAPSTVASTLELTTVKSTTEASILRPLPEIALSVRSWANNLIGNIFANFKMSKR